MAEFKSLDEEFADLLLDSDAELNGEPASEGVLLLENDDESDDDEERDEKENRVFRDAGWSKEIKICHHILLNLQQKRLNSIKKRLSISTVFSSVMSCSLQSAKKQTDKIL
ncbi:hypothetical protein Q1695_009012 [Nippostrongylus brasiliensis]|nr:hypothetical protein Q1695_009012 [Nippostrongylus brasiliensis]